jgi:lipopolysaccharide/colanic/teichoic acid biosynthesis glycosyltransferase
LKLQFDYLHSIHWRGFLLLAVLHFSLVIFTEKALVAFFRILQLRLRLAFVVSAGLSIFVLLQCQGLAFPGANSSPAACDWGKVGLYLGSAFCAAFIAALLATNQYVPLWEDNLTPSDEICLEVFKCHQPFDLIAEGFSKRLFDLSLAALGLALSSPFWILCLFLIWFEDPGPVLFVKNSVGKGGLNFKQLKLRTMVYNAEAGTGPVQSPEFDQRVLKSGRLLRKTALDELPQLINILKSEMSFVGPRPQRTVLVNEYLKILPEYAARHRVLPGLAGLAQVAGDYYLSPRQKLRFDSLYIQHKNLGFDLKLLFLAFLVAFWFRWHKGWNGRLPRGLLHSGG